jgi:hypothetical protein
MKMNKVSSLVLFVSLATSAIVQAQKPEPGKPDPFDFEKFKSEKIAFITKAIELTPQEAEKFWPVYNEFEKSRFDIMNERRDLQSNLHENKAKLTDKDCAEISRKMAMLHKKEGELMIKYNEDFLKILPAKKVIALYEAEGDFRRQLLKEYRNRNKEDKK